MNPEHNITPTEIQPIPTLYQLYTNSIPIYSSPNGDGKKRKNLHSLLFFLVPNLQVYKKTPSSNTERGYTKEIHS